MFDIGLWNVMEQTLAEESRTNNHAEAWHRGFQTHVGCHRPTNWKFLDVLKKEEKSPKSKGSKTLPARNHHRKWKSTCRQRDVWVQ